MKRLGSSDSLGALITVCPEEKSSVGNLVFNRGFQSMLDGLDEEDCVEESGQITEKKRRLSVTQVKALEKNFEVENKLEPERKVKLAQELGLQPRQVAVWFQNRRARWKTKQLERDYGILKANYEELKLNFDALQHDKESLFTELRELKSKLIQEENTESNNISIKEEEVLISESEEKATEQSKITFARDPNHDCYNNGSSDSDSSAILNEGNNSPNAEILQEENHILISPACCYSSSSPSSMNCFSFSDSSKATATAVNTQKGYQHQFVRMEEHNFFSAEEPCNFFSEDQAPTLQWYCSDQWS